MPKDVFFYCVFDVKSGRSADFKALATKLAALSQKEDGCLGWECSLTADGSTAYMVEHFRDSASIHAHIAESFSQCAAEWDALVSLSSFVVAGDADESVRSLLPPTTIYVSKFVGF